MKFRYDLKFINRNGFELTFKLSIAFFIVKDKRSITFGSFEKQACSNISFLHKFCRLKKSLKVVVGAQNVSDKQGSNMLQTITGMFFCQD